jgi:hypothetical protein
MNTGKINIKEFDNEQFQKDMGLKPNPLQPYNFERYKAFNPDLTEPAYKHLRQNRSEWKILCGLGVYTHWGCEILKEVWWRKGEELYKDSVFYKFRYVPDEYLNLEW